jgi:retron-type reverse transcriptase
MGDRNGYKHTQKRKKSKCENYRGITLLPTVYKLFANTIQNRLNKHLENEMEEKKCGFRKGRSCTDAIFTMQQIIEKRKEHNLPLFLIFIDYEKAYDNVNRDRQWEMMDNKIPNYLLNTLKCIYRKTKVVIKFSDDISEPIQINKGVRQGCVLSPALFNIYIIAILQEFKTVIKKGIQLNNRKLINTILYADDQI